MEKEDKLTSADIKTSAIKSVKWTALGEIASLIKKWDVSLCRMMGRAVTEMVTRNETHILALPVAHHVTE